MEKKKVTLFLFLAMAALILAGCAIAITLGPQAPSGPKENPLEVKFICDLPERYYYLANAPGRILFIDDIYSYSELVNLPRRNMLIVHNTSHHVPLIDVVIRLTISEKYHPLHFFIVALRDLEAEEWLGRGNGWSAKITENYNEIRVEIDRLEPGQKIGIYFTLVYEKKRDHKARKYLDKPFITKAEDGLLVRAYAENPSIALPLKKYTLEY